jgi:hypothetical protein
VTASPDHDPTGDLADLLGSMETHVRQAGHTARIDEQTRLNLLMGHAIFGVAVGPTFALLAISGMTSVLRRIPGSPLSLALLVGAAGAVLAVATWRRSLAWEYGALIAMLAWYALVSASLFGAVAMWLAEPGPPDWHHAPAIYPGLVYLHLAYALAAHARTLRRKGLRRTRRPE